MVPVNSIHFTTSRNLAECEQLFKKALSSFTPLPGEIYCQTMVNIKQREYKADPSWLNKLCVHITLSVIHPQLLLSSLLENVRR